MHSVDSTHYIDVLSLVFLNADFFYLQLQLSSHDASVDNSLDVAEEDEPDGELFEDELHEDLYKEDDLDEEEPDEELYEAYEIEEELLLEE